MKILLVDDQESVIRGLQKGVEWDALGFEQVCTAFCAQEAKDVLLRTPIDILLCDIEMPGESGIQLLEWIRAQKLALQCIFLTAHAEFDYAVDAMKMGSVDYILQPAPYDEITASLKKAIARVRAERETEQFSHYGRIVLEDRDEMQENLLHALLAKRMESERYASLRAGLDLPAPQSPCVLAVLQIQRWKTDISRWEDQTLHYAIRNIAQELFAAQGLKAAVTAAEHYDFVLLAWPAQASAALPEAARAALAALEAALSRYLDMTVSLYAAELHALLQTGDAYPKLQQLERENVFQRAGLFFLGEAEDGAHAFSGEDCGAPVARWMRYLDEGLYESTKEEILRFLEQAGDQTDAGREYLMRFHYSYMNGFLALLARHQIAKEQIFRAESPELYANATDTAENLGRFIGYTIDALREYGPEPPHEESQEDIIRKVRQYITDNIETDITRSELADYVHLNEDYLTRIFKKETGLSLKEYIIREKMKIAQSLIRTTNLPIGFVAAKIGYCNFSHFSKAYKKEFGAAPLEERRNRSENDHPKSE